MEVVDHAAFVARFPDRRRRNPAGHFYRQNRAVEHLSGLRRGRIGTDPVVQGFDRRRDHVVAEIAAQYRLLMKALFQNCVSLSSVMSNTAMARACPFKSCSK